MFFLSAATCTGSAQDEENPAMELYNDTVVLKEGNFTFVPSNNASASYEISNFTDLGALYATGLDFKVTDLGKMAGEMNGNMPEKTFVLESIEGYQNNNETREKWFILINGVQATADISMNPVSAGDTVSFLYALEEGGEPVLGEAKYLVKIGISTEAQIPDIIETATQAGNFTTLLAAIGAANLTETLKGEGPYTVFAPNDEAFNALPNGTVEALLNDT
ncbi:MULTISPECIES: fasciclin domain-containing protein, partial [unclassified Methanosarcina]